MPPRYTLIGQMILDDPAEARARLAKDYEKVSGNKSTLAKLHGVDYATVQRWFRRLRAAGYPVEPAKDESAST